MENFKTKIGEFITNIKAGEGWITESYIESEWESMHDEHLLPAGLKRVKVALIKAGVKIQSKEIDETVEFNRGELTVILTELWRLEKDVMKGSGRERIMKSAIAKIEKILY